VTRAKVVITHWVHDEVIELLERSCTVVANRSRETHSRDEILRRSRDAEALMAFMPDRIDEDFLDACPRLRIIAAALKGYDNFDVTACTRRSVWLTIAPSLLTEPTAELAVGLLLGISRNIPAGDRLVRSGEFRGWQPVLYGKSLAGATVGVVGMGAIGQAVAGRLAAFGSRVIYSDPRALDPEAERALGLVRHPLEDLLAESDFILVTAPLTAQSRHILDAAALARVKPGGYLVNIGRGSVLDEAAVAAALSSGQLAGYAADVYEFEDRERPDRPLGIHPALLACPDKTLFTPHLGSAVEGVRLQIELEAARAILSVLGGAEPVGAINNPSNYDPTSR
jgi:phosphonate dehydrogenase